MTPYYEADGITLYCADCRELLPSLKADCVVTDPPYGTGERLRVDGEFVDTRQSWDRWDSAWRELVNRDSLGERLPAAIFVPQPRLAQAFAELEDIDRVAAWVLPNPTRRQYVSPSYGWQPILLCGPRHCHAERESDWMSAPNNFAKGDHPHRKPTSIVRWLIRIVALESDVVLDPFAGSGTTLVAAKLEGRKAIGIEIEEKYAEIAAKRLSQGVLRFEEREPVTAYGQPRLPGVEG